MIQQCKTTTEMQSNELFFNTRDFAIEQEMNCICESHHIQTALDSKVMLIFFFYLLLLF